MSLQNLYQLLRFFLDYGLQDLSTDQAPLKPFIIISILNINRAFFGWSNSLGNYI